MFKRSAGRKLFWIAAAGFVLLVAFGPERRDGDVGHMTGWSGGAGPTGSLQDPRDTENARLDAEIQHALKTTGTFIPPASRAAHRHDALWVARVDTLACLLKRSIETIQFLDALGKSGGVRNSASDPSKTDCVHVPAGARVSVDDWGGETGVARVWVRGSDRRFMIARHIGVGRAP